MTKLQDLTDDQLTELSRGFTQERLALKQKARAVQDEQDRRVIIAKLADIDPKGVVIKPQGVPSGEVVGQPGAG